LGKRKEGGIGGEGKEGFIGNRVRDELTVGELRGVEGKL